MPDSVLVWQLQDMRQVWINCSLYNKKDTPVAKMGSRADAKFEQLWAASGFDQGGRRRRVTVPANKYEPSLEPEPKPIARKTSSQQRNGSARRVSSQCGAQCCLSPLNVVYFGSLILRF